MSASSSCECATCTIRRTLRIDGPGPSDSDLKHAATTLTLILAGVLARSAPSATKQTIERLLDLRNGQLLSGRDILGFDLNSMEVAGRG